MKARLSESSRNDFACITVMGFSNKTRGAQPDRICRKARPPRCACDSVPDSLQVGRAAAGTVRPHKPFAVTHRAAHDETVIAYVRADIDGDAVRRELSTHIVRDAWFPHTEEKDAGPEQVSGIDAHASDAGNVGKYGPCERADSSLCKKNRTSADDSRQQSCSGKTLYEFGHDHIESPLCAIAAVFGEDGANMFAAVRQFGLP